ncbi:MAG: 4Fe-4S binding protein [Candidatus Cloacimonetes bacterium]|nr:4Fe-4S binding protein [Candidatus Cloacimonadota bacterium]
MNELRNTVILLLILFATFSVNAADQEAASDELTLFEGSLKQIGTDWYLNTGEDFYLLDLAPEGFLQLGEIILQAKATIQVKGKLEEGSIVAYSLVYQDHLLDLRDNSGQPLWQPNEPSKEFYVVDPGKCIGCNLCVKHCPTQAITMVKGKAVIDPDKCIACGICSDGDRNKFKGCPTKAISK